MDRINIQGVNGIAGRVQARGPAPVSQTERARPAASESDQAGAAARSAASRGGSKPPVDEERVAQLRAAIEQGRYPLDPRKTAEAMIAAGFISRKEP